MPNIRFFGPYNNEYSGYGNAVRNFTLAFDRSGIRTKYMFSSKTLRNNPFMTKYKFNKRDKFVDFYLHCPPWSKYKTKSRYKIAYFYWETDRLPAHWAKSLNSVNEIWAPCQLVKDACIKARFKGTIKIVPTPVGDYYTKRVAIIPSPFSNEYSLSNNVYKFYSIFQWNERKGFRELLTSYYKEFKKGDKVILILKVNPLNISRHTKDKIVPEILELKRRLNLKYYPPVYLISDYISRQELHALHNAGDCYVSAHHGEGWGMPIHTAMKLGKQIITTRYGGVTEHLNNKSAHIIKHTLGPVSNMNWSPLYQKGQSWAHPSVNHLQILMRDVYNNHNTYKDKPKNAKIISDKFSIDAIAKLIKKNVNGV